MNNFVLPGNTDLVKQINRSRVLNILRAYSPISKVEIAEKTKLTFATVSNITTELVSSKLVRESGFGGSSGGRKPVLYELNPNAKWVVGVDVGVKRIQSVVINLNGQVIQELELQNPENVNRETLITIVFQSIEKVIRMANVRVEKIAGIGISIPGPVDPVIGTVIAPPNLIGWDRVPLRDIVQKHFGITACIDKDANASVLGEQWFGAAQGKDNAIYLHVDEGIGGGIIIHGRVYRGFTNGAGEIGHGTIDVDGPRCNCGNYGCLESLASGIAVVRRAKEELRRGVESQLSLDGDVSLERVLVAAKNRDKLAMDILNEAGRYLGIGLASFINFFNPETIILGGKMAISYPPLVEIAKDIAVRRSFASLAENVTFQISSLRNQSGVIGAACLVLQYIFDQPVQIIES
jgi:glucokinase-like ROK family protein